MVPRDDQRIRKSLQLRCPHDDLYSLRIVCGHGESVRTEGYRSTSGEVDVRTEPARRRRGLACAITIRRHNRLFELSDNSSSSLAATKPNGDRSAFAQGCGGVTPHCIWMSRQPNS